MVIRAVWVGCVEVLSVICFSCFFCFEQKTAYVILRVLVGSDLCIRDRSQREKGTQTKLPTDN